MGYLLKNLKVITPGRGYRVRGYLHTPRRRREDNVRTLKLKGVTYSRMSRGEEGKKQRCSSWGKEETHKEGYYQSPLRAREDTIIHGGRIRAKKNVVGGKLGSKNVHRHKSLS